MVLPRLTPLLSRGLAALSLAASAHALYAVEANGDLRQSARWSSAGHRRAGHGDDSASA